MLSNSISVVIPAYNRAELIGTTLRSLLAQTLPAHEIIVVDDGSIDRTAQVASAFGAPVRVVSQENAGPGAARNRGFKESSGSFIHFFDSDDIAIPNKHEVQLQALERSGADIAYGPWVKGRISPTTFSPENHVLQQRGLSSGCQIKALLTNWSMVPHACLFRREIVEKSGGFPEDLLVAEDQLMYLNCLLAGAKVIHSPGTLELYRTGEAGKITESIGATNRRARDWAKFLLKARDACLSYQVHPEHWFGFRRRCWQAAVDLAHIQPAETQLIAELTRVARDSTFPQFYGTRTILDRWRGGLQSRINGTRSHGSFRGGPLKLGQIEGIRQLGLELIR
jgi:glycosyltransferase involved in cell wall biosynthesis